MTKDIDPSYRIALLDAENSDDLQTFKSLKINSLIDSPGAFHESLDEVMMYTEEEWKAALVEYPTSVLYSNGEPIGMGKFFPDPFDDIRWYRLGSFWVHPDHRGKGAADILLADIIGQSVEAGIKRYETEGIESFGILLSIARGNDRAGAFYSKHGFVADESLRPPDFPWIVMVRPLSK